MKGSGAESEEDWKPQRVSQSQGGKGEGATSSSHITRERENTPSAVFRTQLRWEGEGDGCPRKNTVEAGVEVHTWFVLAAD